MGYFTFKHGGSEKEEEEGGGTCMGTTVAEILGDLSPPLTL